MKYYRFLLPDEIIEKDDEFLNWHIGEWEPILAHDLNQFVSGPLYGYYRREIPKPCTCGNQP